MNVWAVPFAVAVLGALALAYGVPALLELRNRRRMHRYLTQQLGLVDPRTYDIRYPKLRRRG